MTTTRMKTAAALAFLAFAGTTGAVAQQAPQPGMKGDGPRGQSARFERADADDSGDVSFDEFAAAMNGRISGADADKDGKMTVGEVADQIQKMRAERQARRIIERFDENGDGALTMDEIRSRQQKRFALLDRDNDGKLTQAEMPRGGKGRHGRGGRDRN